MEQSMIEVANGFVSLEERMRLVRLCARLTGNIDAAEDLAQETLLDAWCHTVALRHPERRSQWLSGIARNVCLRWSRAHGRDAAHRIEPHASSDEQRTFPVQLEDILTDGCDIEREVDGRLALITRHESVTDNANFTVISAADTFEVLSIDGGVL